VKSRTRERQWVAARSVTVTEKTLEVDLTDGQTVSVPLEWYPRLLHGTPKERRNWRLTHDGRGIHWYELDEDISVENLVQGKRSGEGQHSLKRWLKERLAWSEPSVWLRRGMDKGDSL